MPNPLYNVPGLGGYLGQEEFNQQQQSQGLEAAQRFQTLQQHLTNFAREQQFRHRMANLPPEQRNMGGYMNLAAEYGSPTDIMHYGGQREAAATRLQQTHQMAMLNFQQRWQTAQDVNTKRQVEIQAMIWDRNLRQQVAQQGLPPDTVLPPFQPFSSLGGGGQAGVTAPPQAQRQWTEPTQQQVPPQDREAYNAVLANAKAGIPSSELGQGGPPPQEPQPTGGPPAEPQPMDENQREMYLLQQRAPAPQGAPIARGIAPPGAPTETTPGLEPIPDYLQQLAAGPLPPEGGELPPPPPGSTPIGVRAWNAKMAEQQRSLPSHSAVRKMAYERLYFGKEPSGWGQMGQPTRTAVRNEWARLGEQLGLTDSETAMLPFDNKIKGQAVLALTKWGATAARSADKLERDLEVALSYAQRIPLAQIQFVNKGIIAGLKEFNSPEANAYASAINSVRLEYARLLSGPTSNAMLPVEAMRTANELVSRGVNVASLKEVGRQMRMDANNTIRATANQIDSMRSSITNVGKTPTFREAPIGPGAVPAPAATTPGRRAEGQRGTSKSGKPIVWRNGGWDYE